MRKPSKTVLGLDIGRHAIKAVLASANGGLLRVHRAEQIPIPPDLTDIGAALRRWWEERHLGNTPVVTSVGGGRVLYQHLRMEPGDPREHEQLARMEAMRFSEMTDSSMEVSVTPASRQPKERQLLLAMARPELLDAALQPCRKAGVNLVNACPSPVALYNGVTALGEPVHQPTLFADLGATQTEVVIGNGRGALFARSFAMGTSQLTQALAGRARVPPQQAERMRVRAASFAELPGDMDEVCANFVRQWMRELDACLQMFDDAVGRKTGGESVRRMLLSGGGSAWKPLAGALKAVAPISLSPVGLMPGREDKQSHEYMIASGLAADGLGIARAPSSLLSAAIRQSLNRRRNKRYWVTAGVFSVAAAGMVVAATRVAFQREQHRLREQTATLKRSDAIRRDSEELQSRKKLVENMIAPLEDFVNNSARVRDLTLYIAEHKQDRDFLTFLGDSESYLQLRLDSAGDRERRTVSPRDKLALRNLNRQQAELLRDARLNRLIVEGFTPRENLASVRDLIGKLGEHPAVERADLLSDDFVFTDPGRDRQWISTGYRRFVLDLQLVEPERPETEDAP